MIKNSTPVPLDLTIQCAKTVLQDRRFYKHQYPSEEYLLELRAQVLSEKKKYRKANFVDFFLPVEVMFYLGDQPDLRRYTDQPGTVIWTATVGTTDNTVPTDSLMVELSPAWYSLYFEHFDWQYQHTQPVKDFNCFINRMDVIRQSWLYLLMRRNMFDRGFVSFNMDVSRLNNYDPAVSAHAVFEQQFAEHMTNFETEHTQARHMVPYRNFDAAEDVATVIMQSRFSIVLETYFDDNNLITFTEKTFRSLVLPRPWLLFCSKNAVSTLRNWGFDVLDDLVDHQLYDNIDHAIQRQGVILDMAQDLCSFDVAKHQHRLCQAASHNLTMIQQWQQDLPAIAAQDTKKLLDKIHDVYGSN